MGIYDRIAGEVKLVPINKNKADVQSCFDEPYHEGVLKLQDTGNDQVQCLL